jgi:hypothetical protein
LLIPEIDSTPPVVAEFSLITVEVGATPEPPEPFQNSELLESVE